ncbi:hypothetical protein PIB30_004146 [Stylosanthes scabra]|uniref:Uncharacterized protein n=1 Tax=Stylosanthes scabra TaxID=79078 RepID=A0ABU6Q3H1_9FABA|nr:hypothetical protein [Stylosanthes scabra]
MPANPTTAVVAAVEVEKREIETEREKIEERERDVVAAAPRRAFFIRRSLACHHPRSSPSQLQTSSSLEEPKRERKERRRGERQKEELSLLPSSSLSPPRLAAFAVWICRRSAAAGCATIVRKSRSSQTRKTGRRGTLTAAAARPGREGYLRGHFDA